MLRQVVWDNDALESAIEIFGSAREKDIALEAAERVLSRHDRIEAYPKAAEIAPGRPLLVYKTRGTARFPAVTLFYTVDDGGQQVTIRAACESFGEEEDWRGVS